MTRSNRTPSGTEWWHAPASRRSAWHDAGGLLPLLAAVALWGWLVTQVLAPLDAALASAARAGGDASEAVTDCPLPAGAFASAAPVTGAGQCR